MEILGAERVQHEKGDIHIAVETCLSHRIDTFDFCDFFNLRSPNAPAD
ncbi:hypothetical protein [Chlorogloeopsis sp. ULAP02]